MTKGDNLGPIWVLSTLDNVAKFKVVVQKSDLIQLSKAFQGRQFQFLGKILDPQINEECGAPQIASSTRTAVVKGLKSRELCHELVGRFMQVSKINVSLVVQ